MMRKATILVASALVLAAGCTQTPQDAIEEGEQVGSERAQELVDKYVSVELAPDLSALSDRQRQMVPILLEAADAMDRAFWRQAYGDRQELLSSIDDPLLRRFALYNYGPWDRLDGNEPFIEGVGPKPPGANMFPADVTKESFEQALAEADEERSEALSSLYTQVVRNEQGQLEAVPYSEHFAEEIALAARKLREAAELAEVESFANYLRLRADALETNEYRESDMAWMDMKDNVLELVIGPIETYEDQVCGCKAAFEAFVLVRDLEWSQRLMRYAEMLPDLQRALPVSEEYKAESPGTNSDLGAYDALYYAGDCNAGAKTIAINLPNDEVVQLEKGSRRLQLKNSMRAKFEKILEPIADRLIAAEQRGHVTFDAFFGNTMFHEVAHGLGVKTVLDGSGSVDEALRERHTTIEEGKADVLGLWLVTELHRRGELGEADLMDNYVTFLSSIFRSIRFGASSAHGRANVMRFNYFLERGAFSRDEASGAYSIDFDKMVEATNALSEEILRVQGDGDYEAAGELMETYGTIDEQLQADLDALDEAGIPVDIVFEQGLGVLTPKL